MIQDGLSKYGRRAYDSSLAAGYAPCRSTWQYDLYSECRRAKNKSRIGQAGTYKGKPI